MKAILITADKFEHKYVANHLSDTLKSSLVGVIVERPYQNSNFFQRVSNSKERYGYFRILERVTTKTVRIFLRQSQRQDRALKKILGHSSFKFTLNCPLITVSSANSPQSIDWIESIQPDYVFIYGTGLIKRKILSIPTKETLNLHTGISPFYRGSCGTFWPLFNQEPQMVGSTVHECTPDIDGGDIYGKIFVNLDSNDDHYSTFAKCVKEGARLYSDIANKIINGDNIVRERQDLNIGKEYRFKDLTFIHELRMEYRIRSGALRRLLIENKNLPYT